jgi:hypothetical protein
MRTVAAVVHAAPGVVGLVAGLLSLAPPRAEDRRGGWRLIHAVCVATLLGGLVALVVYDWRDSMRWHVPGSWLWWDRPA